MPKHSSTTRANGLMYAPKLNIDLSAIPVPPPLHDAKLEQEVFALEVGQHEQGSRRLKQLGDKIVGLAAMAFIRARFPTLTVCHAAGFVAIMVSNKIFAQFYVAMGFAGRLTKRESRVRDPMTDHPVDVKLRANVFEAYCGALWFKAHFSRIPADWHTLTRFMEAVFNPAVFNDVDDLVSKLFISENYPMRDRIKPVSYPMTPPMPPSEAPIASSSISPLALPPAQSISPGPASPLPDLLDQPTSSTSSTSGSTTSNPGPAESSGGLTLYTAAETGLRNLGAVFAGRISDNALTLLEGLEIEVVDDLMMCDEDADEE